IRGGSMSVLFKDDWRATIIRNSRFARLAYVVWAALMRDEGDRLIATSRFARLVHIGRAAVLGGAGKHPDPNRYWVDGFRTASRLWGSTAGEKPARLRLVMLDWPVPPPQRDELARGLAAAEIPMLDVSRITSDPRNVIQMEGHLNSQGCGDVAHTI